jgi:hypothetical protein
VRMCESLCIVTTHEGFIRSATEVFHSFPTVQIVRIPPSNTSKNIAYGIPTDVYGNIYRPRRFPDCQAHIYAHCGLPLHPGQTPWFRIENTICVISPCLQVGLFPYTEKAFTPYRALYSMLMQIRQIEGSHPIEHIVVPALCCDPGGFDPELTSMQMCQAWRDYLMSKADTVDTTHLLSEDSTRKQTSPDTSTQS